MKQHEEFPTIVSLLFSAVLTSVCARYSVAPFVLIPSALLGAYLGYKAESARRFYWDRADFKKKMD
jgi:predicted membrane chloride channel (bestrophin family)